MSRVRKSESKTIKDKGIHVSELPGCVYSSYSVRNPEKVDYVDLAGGDVGVYQTQPGEVYSDERKTQETHSYGSIVTLVV